MRIRATNTDVVKLEMDTLVISFFRDERPLKGQSGLADWRLCGALSRLIMEKCINGHLGEQILFPMNHRMRCNRIFALGLGAESDYDDGAFTRTCRRIADSVFKLQVHDFAMSLPGAIIEGFDGGVAAAKLCEEIGDRFRRDRKMFENLNLIVLADGSTLKDITPIVAKYEHRFNEELQAG